MVDLDWKAIEEQVYAESVQHIHAFALAHRGVTFSCLAYHVAAFAGMLQLCFETPDHALQLARNNEQEAIEEREKWLSREYAWGSASNILTQIPVTVCPYETGEFAYPVDAIITIEGINGVDFDSLHPPYHEGGDSYIDGNIQLVLWRVIDRLVVTHALQDLSLAAPFVIGYQLQGDALHIMRLINWP